MRFAAGVPGMLRFKVPRCPDRKGTGIPLAPGKGEQRLVYRWSSMRVNGAYRALSWTGSTRTSSR